MQKMSLAERDLLLNLEYTIASVFLTVLAPRCNLWRTCGSLEYGLNFFRLAPGSIIQELILCRSSNNQKNMTWAPPYYCISIMHEPCRMLSID
jgi:hypothetical protein